MRQILLIEDSESSMKVVEGALNGLGLQLTVARTLAEAKKALEKNTAYAMVLLDIGLPDGEGLSLLRDNKELKHTPVLLITGKEDIESKVSAFELGAEEYLVKPVNPRELRARVEARLRKSDSPTDTIRRGQLALNFPLMKASLIENGVEKAVDLTSKEFRLVATLAQHEGQVFTRAELVKAIWGNMHVVSRTVDSHICGARRKLGPAGAYIKSVTGEGYKFAID